MRAARPGPADQARFVVAHAALRAILAASVGVDPRELRFATGNGESPSSKRRDRRRPSASNLSHSRDLALVAEPGREVDPECRPAVRDIDAIAGRYYSAAERRTLEALASDQRQDAFLRGWVLKEAYLKACGDGLRRRLDDFDVTLDDEDPPQLLAVRDRPGESHAGASAISGRVRNSWPRWPWRGGVATPVGG